VTLLFSLLFVPTGFVSGALDYVILGSSTMVFLRYLRGI
jgi:hypothetical protein